MPQSSIPPCRKSKDYDAINLYDDIAPRSVSFHHSLESDLGEYGGFSILECVVGSFDKIEAVGHDPSVRPNTIVMVGGTLVFDWRDG